MTDWQTIETAPKNGTSIFLYWPTAIKNRYVVGSFITRGEHKGRWIAAYPNLRPKPTHWMELPEPPL